MSNNPTQRYDEGYVDPITGETYLCRRIVVREGAPDPALELQHRVKEFVVTGLSMTPEDIRSAAFGVAISAISAGTAKLRVSRVRIKLRYITTSVVDEGPAPSNPFRARQGNGYFDSVVAGNGRIVVCGDRGRIRYTDNKGQSWTDAVTGTKLRLWSLAYVKPAQAYAFNSAFDAQAATSSGQITNTQDGNVSTLHTLYCVGASGIILKSTNNGATWAKVYDQYAADDWFSITHSKIYGLSLVGAKNSYFGVGPPAAYQTS